MIDAVVSLNGVEFDVLAAGSIYDAERMDFNSAVERALVAYKHRFPLDPVDFASLEVSIRRSVGERATHAGVPVERAPEFVSHREDESEHDPEPEPHPEDLSDEELEELTAPKSDEDE